MNDGLFAKVNERMSALYPDTTSSGSLLVVQPSSPALYSSLGGSLAFHQFEPHFFVFPLSSLAL